ncbi:phosphoglycerate mutase family protein-like protein [Xylaria telfairii]|nr:phosphoglycerate mutase family protein-like protein [Xylaria telfairii]
MAPTIHIIRHAHAFNNIPDLTYLRDPKLTERGHKQCQTLAAELAELGEIEVVVASPLQRSIQTALAAFKTYTQSKRIMLLAELQEVQARSDIGSSLDDLANQYGYERLDYSNIPYNWTNKSPSSPYAPSKSVVRARATRAFLREVCKHYLETNINICVVTHAMYIRNLVQDGRDVFKNAEWRSYQFNQLEGSDVEASLTETHQTPVGPRERRSRSPPSES